MRCRSSAPVTLAKPSPWISRMTTRCALRSSSAKIFARKLGMNAGLCCAKDSRWCHEEKIAARKIASFPSERLQGLLIVPRVSDVGNQQLSARLENASDLTNRGLPLRRTGNIVNDKAGQDHVEGIVGKWQLPSVGVLYFDAIGHALNAGVFLGGLGM